MPAKRKSARTPKRREPLSRDVIERAALELIDAHGLEDFSTRKLGQKLGCEAMSIYHHFPSKAHLFDALVDRVVGGIALPPPDAHPTVAFRELAAGWRAMALRHPGFYPVLSVHRMNSEVGVRFLDRIVAALHAGGLEREHAARIFRVVGYYLMGAALDEISGYAKGPSSLKPIGNEELKQRFPHIADAGEFFKPGDFDKTFEMGLDLLVDASGLPPPPPRKKRSAT